ncbi:hypothetical protein NJB59_004329, partial [Salmonella enterica]|nr:hypothetical protein [Salmonella enterica]EJJ5141904.1 hypothetical protein [Salmonella enterica]
VFVVVPVVIYVVNFLFFHGNKVTQEQVTQYINDSRIIEVFIPRVTMLDVKLENSTDGNMVEDGSRLDSENYRIKLSRKDNLKRIKRFIFYSKKYNRYMMLINFDGFDYGGPYNFDLNDDRNSVIFSGRYFMVRINNKQWGDVRYGSEKKPVPIFGVTLSGRGYESVAPQVLATDRGYSDVSERLNRIFVEQYLNNFLPNDDFKKLFAK